MRVFSLFLLELAVLCNLTSFGRTSLPQNQPTDDSLKIIEKGYLHVDRDSYFPGDDIWFKAYLVNAADRYLSDHSTNLHVELISPDLIIVDSRIVRLEKGLGNGDFHLSEKLPSGKYRIRAYTNYMRNFSETLFFNKDIKIINSTDALKAFSDTINYNLNKPEITFYPEGGSLVDSVASVVAFQVLDEHGFGYDLSGQIYSSAGEIVTEFKSTHKGMGVFMFDPLPGLKYYTLIKNPNGGLIKYEIPESFSTGIVLNISGNQKHKLSVIFKTNTQTLSLINDHDLTLTVSARGKAFKSYTFRMSSLNSFFNLPTDDLPDGIAMITLSGVNDIPLCERLVYIQNDDEAWVNIETDKTEYNQRDSVNIKISLRVDSRVPQDAFLSLSATDKLFTDNSTGFPATISSWFLLESDVRGPVEDPSYYFDFSNPVRLKDLDLLLLTQGWRDFEWKYKKMDYPTENGFTISGRVRKKFTDMPIVNAKVNMSIFKNSNPLTGIVLTDSSGRFCLKGVDFTGGADLVASVTGEKNNLKGWLLLDSLRYSPAMVSDRIAKIKFIQNNDKVTSEGQLIKESLHTFIQYAEITESFRKQYKLSDTITPGEVNIVARRHDEPGSARARSRRYLMATPDQELIITPKEQVYSNVLNLVATKYLSGRVYPQPGIKPRPLPSAGMGPEMQNPLYLINGLASTIEDVQSLSVSEVERIDVLDKMGSYAVFGAGTGETPIDGVISIILKSDFTASHNSAYHSVNARISGYNEPRIFYSPKHHATLEKDYKPDLRTTLFWEPYLNVQNNKDISLIYYNGDNSSTVKITVEGITTNGIPLTSTTEYEVK